MGSFHTDELATALSGLGAVAESAALNHTEQPVVAAAPPTSMLDLNHTIVLRLVVEQLHIRQDSVPADFALAVEFALLNADGKTINSAWTRSTTPYNKPLLPVLKLGGCTLPHYYTLRCRSRRIARHCTKSQEITEVKVVWRVEQKTGCFWHAVANGQCCDELAVSGAASDPHQYTAIRQLQLRCLDSTQSPAFAKATNLLQPQPPPVPQIQPLELIGCPTRYPNGFNPCVATGHDGKMWMCVRHTKGRRSYTTMYRNGNSDSDSDSERNSKSNSKSNSNRKNSTRNSNSSNSNKPWQFHYEGTLAASTTPLPFSKRVLIIQHGK